MAKGPPIRPPVSKMARSSKTGRAASKKGTGKRGAAKKRK
jgi:hypothetical protein